MYQGYLDHTNAISDDGEWVSWAEINRFIEEKDADEDEDWDLVEDEDDGMNPEGSPEEESSMRKLDRLEIQISNAQDALARGEDIGGRIGEMGELFAEARFRIKRHRKCAQGSDGKIGKDYVEVKTISPWKKTQEVRVKRSGHWSRLVVVKISEQWIFEARMLSRADLGPGNGGKHAKVRWGNQEQRVPAQEPPWKACFGQVFNAEGGDIAIGMIFPDA